MSAIKKLEKLFGDPNKRTIKKMQPLVDQINSLEPEFEKLSDQELQHKTTEFKERLEKGETLDDLLVEAFATVREAAKRVVGQRHYDVQLIGGIALHNGIIAEMKTGEGKTLTSTCPIYLNALSGKGVHVVTVNDYLARRDCSWMGQIYSFLGMSVGCIQNQLTTYIYDSTARADEEDNDEEGLKVFRVDMDRLRQVGDRKEAYRCDITYGTNNEYGFDYLRDNMVESLDDMAQRELHYAIIDEVDSILIDEARTPLIISAPDAESTEQYYHFAKIVANLLENKHFNVDEKMRSVAFTEEGQDAIAKALGQDPWMQMDYETTFHLEAALKAKALYKREKEYVVQDDEVMIVDEFTGRIMAGRRFSEGLHQALEAKENVPIQKESKTLATITFQNYFRMYSKLAGMTGTAETEAEEFSKIYNLDVLVIPTNRPLQRKDRNDLIYKNMQAKYQAILADIRERQQKGQPVLIGTISIEKNEDLSNFLKKNGVEHNVLNAKNHEREAQFIAQAGKKGVVTLATNMAGRGVDIVLGGNPSTEAEQQEVKDLGGLYVIGTERHESRRIDNQLRGRSGRQGDPGESRFYVSLDDDLMRIFGTDRMQNMMKTMKIPDDMPIENKFITKGLERAQEKVEGHNFDIRKRLVEYDDVINRHRDAIYSRRREILDIAEYDETGDQMKAKALEYVESEIENVVLFHTSSDDEKSWDVQEIYEVCGSIFPIKQEDRKELESIRTEAGNKLQDIESRTHIITYLTELAEKAYDQMQLDFPDREMFKRIVKGVMLRSIDQLWMQHLESINHLRTGIGLRGYGQKDPLVEYKREAYGLFNQLLSSIQKQIAYSLYKIAATQQVAPGLMKRASVFSGAQKTMQALMPNQAKEGEGGAQVIANRGEYNGEKVGRNDPCPCGSGKKFKKCHGK